MRSNIKKERDRLTTVRKLSQSEPTDALSGAEDDVSEPSRRRASASSRRHYRRSLSFSLARPLRWGLRVRATVHIATGCSSASSLCAPLATFPKPHLRAATRSAHQLLQVCLPRLLMLLTRAIPPRS